MRLENCEIVIRDETTLVLRDGGETVTAKCDNPVLARVLADCVVTAQGIMTAGGAAHRLTMFVEDAFAEGETDG